MKKRLTKLEIENISKRFGWKYKQTLDYINECRKKDSILDHEEVFRTCYKSLSPIKRFNNIVLLLYDNCKDPVSTITALINQDILEETIILFNISDFIKDNNIDLVTIDEGYCDEYIDIDGIVSITQERFSKNRKLLLDFPLEREILATLKDRKHLHNYEPDTSKIFKRYLDQYELAYNLCDSYISRKASDASSARYLGREYTFANNIILELLPILGFRIFNIEYFRAYISAASQFQYMLAEEQFFRKFKNLFFDINENRNELTNKRNWFYYCLVAKVVESGYKVVPACKKLAIPLSVEWRHLKNKYYAKKSEVQERDEEFNLDEFIKEQGFTFKLREYLDNREPTIF